MNHIAKLLQFCEAIWLEPYNKLGLSCAKLSPAGFKLCLVKASASVSAYSPINRPKLSLIGVCKIRF